MTVTFTPFTYTAEVPLPSLLIKCKVVELKLLKHIELIFQQFCIILIHILIVTALCAAVEPYNYYSASLVILTSII